MPGTAGQAGSVPAAEGHAGAGGLGGHASGNPPGASRGGRGRGDLAGDRPAAHADPHRRTPPYGPRRATCAHPWCGQRCRFGSRAHRADFPPSPVQAASVRRFVRNCVSDFGTLDRYPLDDVDLVVTEMFANAVLHAEHAGASLTVAVRLRGGLLRLEVRDPDRRGCVPSQASEWDDSGRGLLLIECLSQRWGTVPEPGGKVVYAEIASHGPRAETSVHA